VKRIPRRKAYRARPCGDTAVSLRREGWGLLGLAAGVIVTAFVAAAGGTASVTAIIYGATVVLASFLAIAAMGERFRTVLWDQRKMETLCSKRLEVMQSSLDNMGERLTQREQTIATLNDMVADQKNAIINLNGTIATLRYQIDDLKGRRHAS